MELSETSGAAKRRKRRKRAMKELTGIMNSEANDGSQEKDIYLDVTSGKKYLLKVKVRIPVDEHPDFNFVGQLLGPKGSSLQQLQEFTVTKMIIRGRGSMRDKKKEEELRKKGDPKHAHLNEKLHLEIAAYGIPSEAYLRLATALEQIQKFLVPEYQEEPANEYPREYPNEYPNRYGEIYDDYNSRNAVFYPDDPLYDDMLYADRYDGRSPSFPTLREAPRGRGLRFINPPLMRRVPPHPHPYAGAARRGLGY